MKIVRNSDLDFVEEFMERLKKNDGYCPCRLTKSSETKCMCKEFRDKVKAGETGICHCGLYEAVED